MQHRIYSSENLGKKYARFCFWSSCVQELGVRAFQEAWKLVFLGEGGDLHVLRSFGCEHRIVAIDFDGHHVDRLRREFPKAIVAQAELGATLRYNVENWRQQFGIAFLDFCSYPKEQDRHLIHKTLLIAMQHNGVLGYAFQRGREQGELRDQLQEMKSSWRQSLPMNVGISTSIQHRLEAFDAARWMFIHEVLRGPGIATQPRFFIQYHGKRVPMFIAAERVYRDASKSWSRKAAQRYESWRATHVGNTSFDIQPKLQLDDLRAIAFDMLDCGASSKEVSDALMIRPTRIAAWKAHRTMGSYRRKIINLPSELFIE